VHAVHAAVFPLHRQRAGVADVVERDDDGFEIDHAAADAAEVPVAARIAEAGVAAEHAHRAVALAPPHVLHVDVVDAVGEGAHELDVVHALVARWLGSKLKPKRLWPFTASIARCVEAMSKAISVGCTSSAKLMSCFLEGVEDGREALAEVGEAGVPVRLRRRREGVDRVPDRRAGEAGDGLDAELLRGARGVGELLRGALAHAFRIAVAPDVRRQDGLVALVDQVAHRLADQVVADRQRGQAVRFQQRPLVAHVGVAAPAPPAR
jgi:hypothetical protein